MQNNKIKRFFWMIPCLMLGVSSVFMASCDDDDISGSVVDMPATDLWDTTAIGKYVYENYTLPYNIRVIYRWEDNRQDMGKYLVPPKEEKVIPFLSMLKRVWMDPYVEITAETSRPDFLRTYVPKEILVTGSKAINSDGSVTLGFAESGRQIQLYDVNNLSIENEDDFVMFFHTMHHEFAHILQQTNKDYDTEYRVLSKSGYTSSWMNTTNDAAREEGFITAYAKSSVDEDFVEMLSIMLVNSPEAWNYLIDRIQNEEARDILREKERIMTEWMRDVWEIDMSDFQQLVYTAIEKEMNLPDNVDLIHDGNFIIGRIINGEIELK